MTNVHSELIQTLARGYLRSGRALPLQQVHAGLHWFVQNPVQERDGWNLDDSIIEVSLTYEGRWESQLPFPEPIEDWNEYKLLQEAFVNHESGLRTSFTGVGHWTSWTAPKNEYKRKGLGGHWEAVGHLLIGSYGGKKYLVPFSDLPLGIQNERNRLRARKEKIDEIKQAINNSLGYFHNLTPATLELEDTTRQLQKELRQLIECTRLAKEVTPSTYQKELRQYQGHLLAYLGLPIDAPEPQGGAQGIPSNDKLTLVRWFHQ